VGWKHDEQRLVLLTVGDGAIRLASRPFNPESAHLERVMEYASTTESDQILCNEAIAVSKEATKWSAALLLLHIFIFLPE
jgi:hypothetical protein